jgi:hypothetical protein
VPLADLLAGEHAVPVAMPAERHVREVPGPDGRVLGQVERTSWPLRARILLHARRTDAPFPLLRLTVRVENLADTDDPDQPRTEILRHSLIATHLLLGLDAGAFLSLLDPPEWAEGAAKACVNRHVFPVLAAERRELVLCSPIILYDHPGVAPESPGDLHDGGEIDELLSLRTQVMTDEEKAEARATDPRTAAIIDRTEDLPQELMARLHGAIRELRPASRPAARADTVLVRGVPVGPGSLVRLHPRGRGADAHDMFLAGKTATVAGVFHDVDGSVQVAVTLDDDPATDLHLWYGRYFYFRPDELQPPEPHREGEHHRPPSTTRSVTGCQGGR